MSAVELELIAGVFFLAITCSIFYAAHQIGKVENSVSQLERGCARLIYSKANCRIALGNKIYHEANGSDGHQTDKELYNALRIVDEAYYCADNDCGEYCN